MARVGLQRHGVGGGGIFVFTQMFRPKYYRLIVEVSWFIVIGIYVNVAYLDLYLLIIVGINRFYS